ncbi:MAG: DNA polymerase III subunit psi [Bdellovibrionales bacterium]|nr:DNA polymerase III subunit psi [Bdellovibrionales bacterium]
MNRDMQEYLETLGFSEVPYGATPSKVSQTAPATNVRVLFVGHELENSFASTNAAQQLLGKMIGAMGLSPAQVFIADSAQLGAVIERVVAEVTVALGETAAQSLQAAGVNNYVTTFHPQTLLQRPETKKAAWDDLQAVMSRLGLKK